MNKIQQNIDYTHITDLMGKNILSQTTTFKNNEKIVKTVFLNEKNQQVTITRTLVKRGVLERRNWAKFGAAAVSNDGVTTIGPEVHIEYVNDKRNSEPQPKIVSKPEKQLLFSERMKLDKYKKLHEKRRANEKSETTSLDDLNKKQKYIPPNKRGGRKNKFDNDFVVCVKNLPADINRDDLRNIGEEYGDVVKAQVLTDRITRVSKGIGFIHYRTEDEREFAIHHLNNSKLGNMMINAEKAIKKKKR